MKIEIEYDGDSWTIEDKGYEEEVGETNLIVLTTKEIVWLNKKLNKLIESKKFKKTLTNLEYKK